ncbi:MAG: hypothetical protein WCY51_02280 [Sulfurimonas sp.]|uniref:hypothetical protein n=1 Tax=Sulfurimonas sp. TaxID=2022749 RepID=UPI0025DC68E5|nr:hypothetical protein [Sulfurimonas sp.]MCK9454533.1 hypothetical protein [Sulfurimonas sp.]
MRVAVECKSPLMQRSLELFLGKYLTPVKNCDILIRDAKCFEDERCFYISSDKEADLVKPFSKSQLILALEKRYKEMNISETKESVLEEETIDFEILEKRIEQLSKEYQANILKAVRAFYEK